MTLTIREGGSRTLVSLLQDGELDLAVVIQPIRNSALQTIPLLREELLLAVPHDHPLAQRQSVNLSELRNEPFVMLREGSYDLRYQVVAACRRAGFAPHVVLDGAEMDSVPRFVAAGVGVSILPALVLRDPAYSYGQVAVHVNAPRLMRSLVIAHRRDRYFSSAARAFSLVLRQLVGQVHSPAEEQAVENQQLAAKSTS
jgi:DNA-binding transcriptional LysR family regulator